MLNSTFCLFDFSTKTRPLAFEFDFTKKNSEENHNKNKSKTKGGSRCMRQAQPQYQLINHSFSTSFTNLHSFTRFFLLRSFKTKPCFCFSQPPPLLSPFSGIRIYAKDDQLSKVGNMVSLRRRKLLGLCSGKSSFLTPLPRFFDNGNAPENSSQNAKSVSVHPMPSDSFDHMHVKSIATVGRGSPDISGSGSSKEHQNQPSPGQPIKRRKRHRRKHVQNQEPCLMRGVYFKNMKWQAAIKVDKKQIHLGTVGSQEEAARLYDRAAFMCGREPNFELSEEEKQELKQFKWDEFLAYTRHSITNKKHKRRVGVEPQKSSEPGVEDDQ